MGTDPRGLILAALDLAADAQPDAGGFLRPADRARLLALSAEAESFAEAAPMLYTGTLTDALGREYHFVNGKRVAAPKLAPGTRPKGGTQPARASVPRPAALPQIAPPQAPHAPQPPQPSARRSARLGPSAAAAPQGTASKPAEGPAAPRKAPAPAPQTQADAVPQHVRERQSLPSAAHRSALGAIHRGLAAAAHLAPAQRSHYSAAAHAVLQKMTATGARRFLANVSSYTWHESSKALTADLASRSSSVAKLVSRGGTVGGAYGGKEKRLILDGGHTLEGKAIHTAGIYAHEFAHALDGGAGTKRISDTPEWQEAWTKELRSGRISRYAGTSASEGFAEFSRLVLGTKLSAAQVAKEFPLCAAVWRKAGLL